MKKSKVFLALAAVLLVILCCSVAGCFDDPSETDAKSIYSGTRQDRISVSYINASGEHLPWEIITQSRKNSSAFEETVLYNIPDGMSLTEAIEYCSTISNIFQTTPGNTYIQTVIEGNTHDIKDLNTNCLRVKYLPNSSYRLPWEQMYEYSGSFTYEIPENMTFAEAYAYCNTIDDIISIGFDYRAEPA